MRSKLFISSAASVLLIAANAFAARLTSTDRFNKELPFEVGGTLWVDNPIGNIEITGTDNSVLSVNVSRTITADDRTAIAEGREQTIVNFEGDRNTRFVRTIIPAVPTSWASSVSYVIRVPRTVHIRVAAKAADRIRIANIGGNVTVKSFTGAIILDGVSGASIIDTTNGKVSYIYHQKPVAHAQIQAVSADIDVSVPPESSFNWVADTLRGDVLTNLPVRAQILGSAIHGTVNAAGGPTISMQTLLGTIRLLGGGVKQVVRSLRQNVVAEPTAHMEMKTLLMRPAKRFQLPIAGSNLDVAVGVADVEVGEVRGSARVQTVAGIIKLDTVMGDCIAISHGGPLELGDIVGSLDASTEAGDIIVRSVRDGGRVFTAGGLIRVLYSGGAITLQSGGGDIVMRQAGGPVSAETHSGDINITADPNQKTPRIAAHTAQGNIFINLSPKFGADIDAVILTSDADANAIHSDFAGLQIKSDQVGNKTRIHATGKVNGGGERVELYAEEGDIHISNLTASPVSIMPR